MRNVFGASDGGSSWRRVGLGASACVLAATLVGLARASDAIFAPGPGSPFPVESGPNSIATGDFNGDHNTDLVVPNEGTDTVSILLGSRAGSFTAAGTVATGDAPESVAVGDLNGDKNADVAVANAQSDDVSILLGDGAGGFTAGPRVAAGDGAWYVAIGDLDRDRNADLAVSNLFANTVSILLGDGTGGFTAAPTVPVGTFPYGIAIADFNRDRNADLAVANQFGQSVSIVLGDGTGGFSPAAGSPITGVSGPSWVASADLNGDGRADLAVANQGSDTVSVLLGDGSGQFSAAAGSPVLVANCFRPGGACGPTGLVIGDMNGDGKLDLATSNAFSDNISALLGDGAGGFAAAPGSPFAVGDLPFSLALARLNRDGRRDIAAANYGTSDVSVLLNTTAG
jgi:hypothetical protein